jgi:hypothetical protein
LPKNHGCTESRLFEQKKKTLTPKNKVRQTQTFCWERFLYQNITIGVRVRTFWARVGITILRTIAVMEIAVFHAFENATVCQEGIDLKF